MIRFHHFQFLYAYDVFGQKWYPRINEKELGAIIAPGRSIRVIYSKYGTEHTATEITIIGVLLRYAEPDPPACICILID